jgi:hypothetical protein
MIIRSRKIEEGQTIQLLKEKTQKNKQWSTKEYTDRSSNTKPQKPGGKIGCSWKQSSSYSTFDAPRENMFCSTLFYVIVVDRFVMFFFYFVYQFQIKKNNNIFWKLSLLATLMLCSGFCLYLVISTPVHSWILYTITSIYMFCLCFLPTKYSWTSIQNQMYYAFYIVRY